VRVRSYDDYSGVAVNEIVRRGVERVRPANSQGEELRDVVLWLMVLAYAKERGSRVAFVSDNKDFRDEEGRLHDNLTSELNQRGIRLLFYRDISSFIKDNSLETLELTGDLFFSLVPEDSVVQKVQKWLEKVRPDWGRIETVEVDHVRFSSAQQYKVDEGAFYVEGQLAGTARVSVRQSGLVVTYKPLLTQPVSAAIEDWDYDFSQINTLSNTGLVNVFPQYFGNTLNVIGKPIVSGLGFGGWGNDTQIIEGLYRYRFKVAVSARVDANQLILVQVDALEVTKRESVPDVTPNASKNLEKKP
jgi:hypothetical protein